MTKLARDTLADLAARALVTYMREHRLAPGDPLPSETRLAERFGVSRPVVREALQILHGRGLIDARRHRTATVSPPSSGQLVVFVEHHLLFDRRGPLLLLEFRRGVEVEAARLAAERADAATRRRCREVVTAMASVLADHDAYVDADIALHDLIANASGNALIASFLATVRRAARETIELELRSQMTATELRRVQEAHERLVDALEARDADAAGRAMASHFDDAIRAVERNLEQPEADDLSPPVTAEGHDPDTDAIASSTTAVSFDA